MVVQMWKRAALILVSAVVLAACGGDDTASTTSAAPATADETSFPALAQAAIPDIEAGDAALIDVRTQEEWDSGRAAPAVHLPLAQLEAGELPDLPKDTTIYVTCRSGNRAGTAVTILEQAGYTDVTNIGGLDDWQTAGGDVTS